MSLSDQSSTEQLSAHLSEQQIQRYRDNGCLYPVDAFSAADTARFRGELEGMEELQGHVMDRAQCNKSYLLYDWADEIVHSPAILNKVRDLIGPDVLCYMTNLFTKEANSSSYVSMHQDSAYWGVDADDVVTAWVALSPATAESGVMKVQPGSHRKELTQVNTYAKDNLLSRGQEIPAEELDTDKHVHMELEPGQMSLHHFRLVHGSDANTSDERRIGLAIRYVAATARKIGQPESALLVSGENKGGFILEKRAKGSSRGQRYAEHARALRRQIQNLFEPGADAGMKERTRLKVTKTVGTLLSHFVEFRARWM